MRSKILLSALIGLASSTSLATIIQIPASVPDTSTIYGTAMDTSSPGARRIRELSGATYFKGKSTSASLTETDSGALDLKWSAVYDSADGPYLTSVGLELPITPAWAAWNLSWAGSLSFEIKVANGSIKSCLFVESPAYPRDADSLHASLVSYDISLSTSWQTITVLFRDLLVPNWYTKEDGPAIGWSDLTSTGLTYKIGSAVRAFGIRPTFDGAWDTGGTGFKSTPAALAVLSNTISVRNFRVHHALEDAGCESCLFTGIKNIQPKAAPFAVTYHSTLLLSYTVPGPSALVEVRNLSGTRIASFQQAAQARNLSLPVSLARGTYVVSVQGAGARQTALLNVAR